MRIKLSIRKRPSHFLRRKSFLESNSPCIITVAITGDVAEKKRNIAVPISPQEQIESAHEAFDSGARVVHLHVRDVNGNPTWGAERYGEVLTGLKKHCPELLVEFSLGNYAPTIEERLSCLSKHPNLASLCPGSVNFKSSRPERATAFLNSHSDIVAMCTTMKEKKVKPNVTIFDLSMIYNTADLVKQGLLELPLNLMYVIGGHMALEARKPMLEFLISETNHYIGEKNFIWTVVGVGWNHSTTQKWSLELGGHMRTGFEDSLMVSRGVFAKSNKELVDHVVKLAKENNRSIATPQQARQLLSLE